MPSISAARLKQLEAEADEQRREADRWRDRAQHAEDRLGQFDAILDKVVRATDGRPLSDNDRGGYGANYMGSEILGPPRKIKTEERQAEEIRGLNERVVNLESRLAAAKAIASFARAHKA